MRTTTRIAASIAVAALSGGPATSTAVSQELPAKPIPVCGGSQLKDISAEEGFDEYQWYRATQSARIEGPEDDYLVFDSQVWRRVREWKGRTVSKQQFDEGIPEFVGRKTELLVRQISKGGVAANRRYLVVALPSPVIVVAPGEPERGELVSLSTKDAYKRTTWTYLGTTESSGSRDARWIAARVADETADVLTDTPLSTEDPLLTTADADKIAALDATKRDAAKRKVWHANAVGKARKILTSKRTGGVAGTVRELETETDRDHDSEHDYLAVRANGAVLTFDEAVTELASHRIVALMKDEEVPMFENFLWVDTTVRGHSVKREQLPVVDGKAVHHPLFDAAYVVEVTDDNGCIGTAVRLVQVDQHSLDFLGGVDYSRATDTTTTAVTSESDEDVGELFDDPTSLFGVHAEQYVTRFLLVEGDLVFGGTTIESTVAINDAPSQLREADTFRGTVGLQWDLGCGPSTQVCFYGKGEYGLVVPEEPLEAPYPDDYLDRWFAGMGWRYHRPGSRFHGSRTEFGYGRSDNFAANTDRLKIRGDVFMGLDDDWDLRLRAEIDSDGGEGPDELRVGIGVTRDLSFIAKALGDLLGVNGKTDKEGSTAEAAAAKDE